MDVSYGLVGGGDGYVSVVSEWFVCVDYFIWWGGFFFLGL